MTTTTMTMMRQWQWQWWWWWRDNDNDNNDETTVTMMMMRQWWQWQWWDNNNDNDKTTTMTTMTMRWQRWWRDNDDPSYIESLLGQFYSVPEQAHKLLREPLSRWLRFLCRMQMRLLQKALHSLACSPTLVDFNLLYMHCSWLLVVSHVLFLTLIAQYTMLFACHALSQNLNGLNL